MSNTKIIKGTTIVDTYSLTDDDSQSILLTVKPGVEGQATMTTVKTGNTILIHPIEGSISKQSIGTTHELRGKRIRVITTIVDVTGSPDETSFYIKITGGVNDFIAKTNVHTVSSQNEVVNYTANILFSL